MDLNTEKTYVRHRNYAMSERYFSDLAVSEMDYASGPYYLAFLESSGVPFDLRVSIRSIKDANTPRFLKRLLSERKTEMRVSGTSISGNETLKRQVNDLENILQQYEKEGVQPVNVSFIFRIFAEHPAVLNERVERVVNDLRMLGVKVVKIKSSKRSVSDFFLPAVNRRLNYLMNTRHAATIVPIFREPFDSENGSIIGVDDLSEKFVKYNPFSQNSHNILVMGETGSGKSYFGKLLLTRNIRSGIAERAIIFDPLNEYFCSFFEGDCSETDIQGFLGKKNSGAWFGHDEKSASNCNRIIIIKPRAVDMDNHELIYLLLREINSLMMDQSGQRTLILIDECHIILRNPENGKILSQMVRHSRHFNTGIVNISQNTDDFLNERTNSIAFNSNRIFIFRTRNFKEAHRKVLKLDGFDFEAPERLMGGKMHPYSECIVTDGEYCRKLRVFSSPSEDEVLQRF